MRFHRPDTTSGAGGETARPLSALIKETMNRSRVVGWLLLFIVAYRLGLPVLYAAALSAVPWLLMPRED